AGGSPTAITPPTVASGSFAFLDRALMNWIVTTPVAPGGPSLLAAGGISADGDTAYGGITLPSARGVSFVWRSRAARFILVDSGDSFTNADVMSPDGSTLAGVTPSGPPFRWTEETGITRMCSSSFRPRAISAHGKVIAGTDETRDYTSNLIWDERHG